MKAKRIDRLVSPSTESTLVHYLKIADRTRLSPDELALSIASALFIDHYVPGMFWYVRNILSRLITLIVIVINPRDVFGTLYRKILIQAYGKVYKT